MHQDMFEVHWWLHFQPVLSERQRVWFFEVWGGFLWGGKWWVVCAPAPTPFVEDHVMLAFEKSNHPTAIITFFECTALSRPLQLYKGRSWRNVSWNVRSPLINSFSVRFLWKTSCLWIWGLGVVETDDWYLGLLQIEHHSLRSPYSGFVMMTAKTDVPIDAVFGEADLGPLCQCHIECSLTATLRQSIRHIWHHFWALAILFQKACVMTLLSLWCLLLVNVQGQIDLSLVAVSGFDTKSSLIYDNGCVQGCTAANPLVTWNRFTFEWEHTLTNQPFTFTNTLINSTNVLGVVFKSNNGSTAEAGVVPHQTEANHQFRKINVEVIIPSFTLPLISWPLFHEASDFRCCFDNWIVSPPLLTPWLCDLMCWSIDCTGQMPSQRSGQWNNCRSCRFLIVLHLHSHMRWALPSIIHSNIAHLNHSHNSVSSAWASKWTRNNEHNLSTRRSVFGSSLLKLVLNSRYLWMDRCQLLRIKHHKHVRSTPPLSFMAQARVHVLKKIHNNNNKYNCKQAKHNAVEIHDLWKFVWFFCEILVSCPIQGFEAQFQVN